MRNILVAALLIMLTACQGASNIGHEVPRWFGPSAPRDMQQNAQNPNAPAGEKTMYENQAPVAMNNVDQEAHRAGLKANPVKVALLLPLTGDKSSLGRNFMNAAQMAVMDVGGEGFELMPKDSGADPAKAAASAAEAVQAGAALIVGPVFGATIPAVRQAAPYIPILALSNDTSMAGSNVYIMGFGPAEQVGRIMNYAAQQNVHSIAVLAPSTAYAELVLKTLDRTGVSVAHVYRYQNNRASIDKAVAEMAAQMDSVDGIFIPEGGSILGGISDALTKNNISAKVKPIFGTGLWDDSGNARNVALLGGYYAAPDPQARARFVARFQKNYHSAPTRLATLAYDATALAAVLAAQGRGYDEAALTSSAGFAGLDGIFRFDSSHVAQRALAVMQMTPAGGTVVEPAAERF